MHALVHICILDTIFTASDMKYAECIIMVYSELHIPVNIIRSSLTRGVRADTGYVCILSLFTWMP